ncbi:MAG: helix-turn-helix domain-containing protein [Luteitalea sp.]|nr:helix-turn-helix domain-containing protein [Luteitalea sp.]
MLSVPGLEKGLSILELLAGSRRGLSLSEIARKLTLPKSTTHCLLVTLKSLCYVSSSESTGRYFVGLKLVDLGNQALRGLQLREQTISFLRSLQEATQLTVHLAILEHDDIVLLEKLKTAETRRIATWVGRRMDAHCTGVGKAILAHLPDADLHRCILEHGLPRHNENTIASEKRLEQELERIRKQGFALDDEEDELGFRCIAAPIFDGEGVVAAVSVVGTLEQITADNLAALAVEAKTTAGAISRILKNRLQSGEPAGIEMATRP